MPDLVESMKNAALQAMESSKPVNVVFGTVVSEDPIKICVEQKMTLESEQLVFCRNVTEHDIDVTVHWGTEDALSTHTHGIGTDVEPLKTETGGTPPHDHSVIPARTSATNLKHNHAIEGRKTMTVHAGLVLGEKVVLIRLQGGQQYLVIDRVG